jgi:hypothetical protein
MREVVRWNLKVSKKTDLTLRTYLGSKGMKKGDLSKFIERAVRVNIFDRTMRDLKTRKDIDPAEFQTLLKKAEQELRADLAAIRDGS